VIVWDFWKNVIVLYQWFEYTKHTYYNYTSYKISIAQKKYMHDRHIDKLLAWIKN